jgi:hypothetical protein
MPAKSAATAPTPLWQLQQERLDRVDDIRPVGEAKVGNDGTPRME